MLRCSAQFRKNCSNAANNVKSNPYPIYLLYMAQQFISLSHPTMLQSDGKV
jgi:hypothetical protein